MSELFGQTHEVVIAGSGPAGLTAAIYAARANLAPVLIHGDQAGGQLTDTTEVENYPGYPNGVQGPELVEQMRLQAERFGTRFVHGRIDSVDLSNRPFAIHLDGKRTISAKTLILSTGATARPLGLAGEMDFRNKWGGVSACAVCDGRFYQGKTVAVVGGGDTAMEEATYLTNYCERITVIHRRDSLRASAIMQERAKKNPKIEFLLNRTVAEILGFENKKFAGLRLKNELDGSTSEFKCDGLFTAIGHDPNTAFLAGQLKTNPAGFIEVQHPSTRASIPGVFACGDVMDPHYKQAVTAAGTGCMAALDAERFLAADGR